MIYLFVSRAHFVPGSSLGEHAHIGQWFRQMKRLGHRILTWQDVRHPDVEPFPRSWSSRVRALRKVDVVYTRIDGPLYPRPSRALGFPFARRLLGRFLNVWEFNASPELHVFTHDLREQMRCRRRFRSWARTCDLAVCVSAKLAEYSERTLGIRNAVVVPNGSDPSRFRPDAPRPVDFHPRPVTLNVVWMGHDFPWNRMDLLTETAWTLEKSGAGKRIRFYLIGSCSREWLSRLPPNVEYCGPKRYDELPGWLSSMHVGLCLYRPGPSEYNSPLKVFDYLSSGLAVVNTPQPQIDGIHREMGTEDLIVPQDSPEKLAEVLIRLSEDPQRLRSVGQRGRQLILERYNWEESARRVAAAVEAARRGRRRSCA